MFPREYRPLKRPRLGVPDFYPQDDKQREDELSFHTLNIGFRLPLLVDTQDEYGSALKDFSQHLLNPKEYSHRVNQVVDEKKKRRWVQDSERRKFQVTKDNFFPVPLGRNRKEIATQWFQELAGNKPLSTLAKKVPVFNKKEEIFDNLCEKDVPISRAAWYIKMTAAHGSTITDLKLNKKKQSTYPSFEWTVSLTKYMQECVWRICNEPNLLSRQDSMSASGGRHPSSSSVAGQQGPSEEGLVELSRWQYMVYLSSWMYQESLLDSHEFLRWLVERVDHIKSSDTKAIQLYLPLVLKHLLDIGSCVALARPLVKYCCQRLAAFFELEQKLAKFQTQPPASSSATTTTATTPSTKIHQDPHTEGGEDDSVFDTIKREPNIKTEPGTTAKTPSGGRKQSSSHRDRKHTATTPSTLGGDVASGEVPIITMKMEDGGVVTEQGVSAASSSGATPASYFHWCTHHQALMLQLCCVIQTIAIRCPTAFVHTKVFIGRGGTVRDSGKTTQLLLSLLPMGLTELPMPRTLGIELQKKLLPALASAEQEIFLRNKAVESDWSAVTVADLQTTSEGSNVQQVLKLLGVLDTHSFLTSRAFNPLTTLYHRLSLEQRNSEHPLADDMLVMLLCQWAVTPHRSGVHRPLVVARILRQRQDHILRGADWKDELDKHAMDESWEEFDDSCYSRRSDFPLPFQAMLLQFLDQRAPLPEDLSLPVKTTDPFYHLMILFSELIQLDVFSYSTYLSTLIARGDTKTPIIPYLPFAREEGEEMVVTTETVVGGGGRKRPASSQDPTETTLNCSIPLPALKHPRLDTVGGGGSGVGGGADVGVESVIERGSQSSLTGIASGPPSPGGFGTDFMAIFSSGGGSGSGSGDGGGSNTASSIFPPDDDESKALFHQRAQQLQMLTSETSRLVSPLDFSPSHTDTDAPSTPAAQTKSDPFNFSILFADEEQSVDPTLDRHASRHLIFAAYFPVSGSGFSRQDHNERAVVLCGVGKTRQRVESLVKGMASEVEHYLRLLEGISTPILPDMNLRDLMGRFRSLPSFEQRSIAASCENIIRNSLQHNTYPSCAQLVFLCELLQICGAIGQLISLLVDVVAGDMSEESSGAGGGGGGGGGARKGGAGGQVPPVPPLPEVLCLPVLWLLQKYLSCLLLSQQDTTVVFENLIRVLSEAQPPPQNGEFSSSSQKATFLFLHHLYTNCVYLQTTFRSSFGHLCMVLGDSAVVDSFSPYSTEAEWQQHFLVYLSKPGECNIPSLCQSIKNNYPKIHFNFAVDVFVTACQRSITCHSLSDLANVCAGVSCSCGAKVNKELMGALRALCIPSQAIKSCNTGYSHLTRRVNVLADRGIHGNVITFVALLLANHCFHLHDIITYIIKPIIRAQLATMVPNMDPASQQHAFTINAFEFVSSLILHLFVSDYTEGVPKGGVPLTTPIPLPQFVQHCLSAKCRDLSLGYILMLLKDVVKVNQHLNRISAVASAGVGGMAGGMVPKPVHTPLENVLNKLKSTLEHVACQPWVRRLCSQQPPKRLLDSDMLGEKHLGASQARYLFLLLCPYVTAPSAQEAGVLSKKEPSAALEHILKNLDQWTLNNALLHIDVIISQTSNSTARSVLLEELASQVIHVFEDSCGDEWLGQTIECCADAGDGSFSPSVWLVTPLISRLQEGVLGRVLKSAGNVLGQGQWWNPEKNQEKRRATRATSGVATPKTGLQWQQPFLELVLACMHAQSATHEELLGPLKSQLSTFLGAFDKEGMPNDEQGKGMLYAALKLRLSLVGSMLNSICVSESTTLEWLHLLMQFICSGSIDRQTDSSELFTNCLDMICTLLHSLSSEFHNSLANWGEDGKKSHTACIKKLKSELAGAKSYCSVEIRQLFPLSQKSYSVTTVKPPPSVAFTKGGATSSERIKGLRIQDNKDISPWEILEGVKNSGPLMLSWFGAIRMKRRPLWLEEQRHLVRFHTHQSQFQNLITGPHTVKLPSEEQVVPAMPESQAAGDEKGELPQAEDTSKASAGTRVSGAGEEQGGGATAMQPHTQMQPGAGGGGGGTAGNMGAQGAAMGGSAPQGGMNMPHGNRGMQDHFQIQGARNPMMGQHGQPQFVRNTMTPDHRMQMKERLLSIQRQQTLMSQRMKQPGPMMPPPMYPGMMGGAGGDGGMMSNYSMQQQVHRQQQLQAFQQRHFQQQRRLQYMKMQQQQQQHMQQQHMQQFGAAGFQASQGAHPAQGMPHAAPHGGLRPMQANPPMPMRQVMQQQQQQGGFPPGGHSMMPPPSGIPPGRQYAPHPQQGPPRHVMPQRPPMF